MQRFWVLLSGVLIASVVGCTDLKPEPAASEGVVEEAAAPKVDAEAELRQYVRVAELHLRLKEYDQAEEQLGKALALEGVADKNAAIDLLVEARMARQTGEAQAAPGIAREPPGPLQPVTGLPVPCSEEQRVKGRV